VPPSEIRSQLVSTNRIVHSMRGCFAFF
jgi:hypothetical protein